MNQFGGFLSGGIPGGTDSNGLGGGGQGAGFQGELVLVKADAGLTNYTHTPVIRNPMPNVNSQHLDELSLMVKSGTARDADIDRFSIASAGLNLNHSGMATIRGGWSEYNKGMLKLTFRLQNGGLGEEYVNVIGYVTGNGASDGLSGDAMFTPVFSWRSMQTLAGGFGIGGESLITNTIGTRTDYILNDGSNTNMMVSLRPGDVLDDAAGFPGINEISAELQAQGIPKLNHNPTSGTSNIAYSGLVPSKRKNFNSTEYAKELLKSCVNIQKDTMTSSGMRGSGQTTSMYDNELNLIINASTNSVNAEPSIHTDAFLNYIKTLNEGGTYAGFRGWRISDLVSFFPNFTNCLSTVFADSNRFEIIDFTAIANMFGSNSLVECLAQEINFSTLDLLVSCQLSAIRITGSNCDNYQTDDALSNIVVIPSEAASLKDNDGLLFQNQMTFADKFKNQFLARLNGGGINMMTPIRFTVEVELMGATQVWITAVDVNSQSNKEIYYSFPTYSPSPYSPVTGDQSSLNILSQSVYGGIKSYFMS